MPCFRAFFADLALPSGDFGPELRAALRLLASAFLGLVMLSAVSVVGGVRPSTGVDDLCPGAERVRVAPFSMIIERRRL
jgi:hypothetical protein